jgi:hypothetical protein
MKKGVMLHPESINYFLLLVANTFCILEDVSHFCKEVSKGWYKKIRQYLGHLLTVHLNIFG